MNLPLQLDRTAPVPLQDQLFEQLRQLILSGRLKPNTRLIATRFLAEQAGVSRRTVLFAYERLIAEGYLETRPAIGTFVSQMLPDQGRVETSANSPVDVPRQAALYPPTLRMAIKPAIKLQNGIIDFDPDRHDMSHLLAQKVWLRWMREVLAADPGIFAKPGPAAGVEALRQVIANYLAATRGILATPEQIIIVSGRRHACSLVAHLFQRPSNRVVVESPGDPDIAGFFRTRGAEIIAVPADENGLDTDALPPGPVSLAYVTPARQNPLGGIMTQSRRTALIEWARTAGAYLIEDDSDSDLRYQGTASPPLATLDPYGLVFYMGSFAKTLGAGLALGYLLAPPEFTEAVVAIKAMGTEGGQCFEQMVVANLLASGEYDHHLRRLRKIYLERRDALIGALRTYFGEVALIGSEAGTQVTWVLPPHFPGAAAILDTALARGVRLCAITGENGANSPYHDRALVLGFGGLAPDRLREGIASLSHALRGLRV
jgi:Transcriptional regulators containing a DNA-binding HTH domain and an aminotransferase domain (MocR family) and their eukaryotic orthologs